jgi:hypothetical protein
MGDGADIGRLSSHIALLVAGAERILALQYTASIPRADEERQNLGWM